MFDGIDVSRFRGQRVGVIYGGDSGEREVSLRTGAALERALTARGYEVSGYDFPADVGRLITERPAAVLLGLHGGAGEDGSVQGFLRVLGIPYSGSGVLASALSMDKALAKSVWRDHGVSVAEGVFVSARDFSLADAARYLEAVPLPNVVKLNDAGSSIGVWVCHDEEAYRRALSSVSGELQQGSGVLFERFVEGPEYSVGVFEGEVLGSIEIQAAQEFYDYEAKYSSGETRYIPVEDKELGFQLGVLAQKSCRVLGCQGVARVDIMGTPDRLVVLEVNTLPGMTQTSLVPKMAQALGIGFEEFAEYLLATAHL